MERAGGVNIPESKNGKLINTKLGYESFFRQKSIYDSFSFPFRAFDH